MSDHVNLVKLCVGADGVDDLRHWQQGRIAQRKSAGLDPRPRHVTRMWPKRAEEVLDGGSLYWVFKGAILARQSIESLDEVIGDDGIRRCAIVMSPEIVPVEGRPRRPFQGWRYLKSEDAPGDLKTLSGQGNGIPLELANALNTLGVVVR